MLPEDNIGEDGNPANAGEEANLDTDAGSQEANLDNAQETDEPPTRGIVEKKEDSRNFYQKRQEKKAEARENEEDTYEIRDEEVDQRNVNEIIDRRIKEMIGDKMSDLDRKHSRMQVNDFIKENPQYAEVRDKIEKYSNHPARRNVPVEFIALECLGYERIGEIAVEEYKKSIENKDESMIGGDYTDNDDGIITSNLGDLPPGFGKEEE